MHGLFLICHYDIIEFFGVYLFFGFCQSLTKILSLTKLSSGSFEPFLN